MTDTATTGEQSTSHEAANQDERAAAQPLVDLVREYLGTGDTDSRIFRYTGRPTLLAPDMIRIEFLRSESDFFTVRAGTGDEDDPEVTATYRYDKVFTDEMVADEAAGKMVEPDSVELNMDGVPLSEFTGEDRQRVIDTVANTVEDLRAQLASSYEEVAPA